MRAVGEHLAAAEQLRDQVLAHQQDEDQHRAGDDAGLGQRHREGLHLDAAAEGFLDAVLPLTYSEPRPYGRSLDR